MNLQNAHKETRDWMAAFGQETPEVAVVPTKEVLQLRYKLIDEEINKELLPGLDGLYFALGEYKKRDDFLQTLDGLGDSLFVVIGTFVALGVDTQQVWNEIVKSNWTKFWTWEEVSKLPTDDTYKCTEVFCSDNDQARNWLVKNQHGKIIKSPSFTPPDLKKFLPKELVQQQ